MQAIDRLFTQVISEGSKQFIVPVFQRDYRWGETQWNQLWDDILRAGGEPHNTEHFLGSIVSIEVGQGTSVFHRWQVIDGQQRLATLSLLLTALRDHIADIGWSGGEDSPTSSMIDNQFLKNRDEQGERHYRLLLRRADNSTLRALIDGQDPTALEMPPSERVSDAYTHFKQLIADQGININAIWQGIANLRIVDVTLSARDNPQLVFESLNSTGLDLSQSDLIRNYLLMQLEDSEQTRLYEQYWNRIEFLFKRNEAEMTSFLRDYVALKRQDTNPTRHDRIYEEFKKFAVDYTNGTQLETQLDHMREYASYYAKFRGFVTEQSAPIAGALSAVRRHSSAPALLVMKLYDYYVHDKMTETEFVQLLRLIESYLYRRALIGLRNNSYWSVFAGVAYQINEDEPYQSLQLALLRPPRNYGFPNDADFLQTLTNGNLYGKGGLCKYLLDRLENDGQREPSPTGDYSIEHIMPQTLNQEWQTMLGCDWEQAHDDWLHRLGNLTLTAYNSEYSNRPFAEKKAISGGFDHSAVRLNTYVRQQTNWTAVEIEERGLQLAQRALQIWSYVVPDDEFVQQTDIAALKERESRRGFDTLNINEQAKMLLVGLDKAIRTIDEGIIAPIERNSVCYYNPDYFLEILPSGDHLRLLLNINIEDLDDPAGIAEDVTGFSYLRYATNGHPYGTQVWLSNESQIGPAVSLIRQGYEMIQ